MSIYGYTGKTAYVLGLGKSGRASVQALLADGTHVWMWDDDPGKSDGKSEDLKEALRVAPEALDIKAIDVVVKSPGIGMDHPVIKAAKKAKVEIVGDIDLFWRREKERDVAFIGITGTNGKSTTTALVGHLLEKAGYDVVAGGNLGTPVLALPQVAEGGFYVLELSSYQLETMNEMLLDAACLLNLTADHLERHGDMKGYLAAKKRIFARQDINRLRVIGVDDEALAEFAETLRDEEIPLIRISASGQEAEVIAKGRQVMVLGEDEDWHTVVDLSENISLPGVHNMQNALAAVALVAGLLDAGDFAKGFASFKGLPHRSELVRSIGHIRFVNDSKATNPDAANHALDSFKNIYWIVGGRAKAEGIAPCLNHLQQVKGAFVIGEAQEEFVEVLCEHVPTTGCETLENAVATAWKVAFHAGEEAVILLSPACASWDQFENFEQRGARFAELVTGIKA